MLSSMILHQRPLVKNFLLGSSRSASTWWSSVEMGPPGPILAITEAFKEDTNPKKISLGVRAFHSYNVKPSISACEKRIADASFNHEYLPIGHNAKFCQAAAELAFGTDSPIIKNQTNVTVQGLSGTGSLTLGAAFLRDHFPGTKDLYLPASTCGNHIPLFKRKDFNRKHYQYHDTMTCGFAIKGGPLIYTLLVVIGATVIYIKLNHKNHKAAVIPEPIQQPITHVLPEHIPYLLVGGGAASHSAMREIRAHDPKAKVLIITREPHQPYMRPALSKDLWFTERDSRRQFQFKFLSGREKSIFYEIDEFYIPIEQLPERETGGVSLITNLSVTHLSPEEKITHLENGQAIKYDKCLLATGGKPKTLPQLEAAPDEIKRRVVYFRTADDFLRLEEISEKAKRIVIIGGGFLGSELACALANRAPEEQVPKDQKIYQIYPEAGNLGKILPAHLSEHVSEKIKKEGAHLIPNVEVKQVELADDKAIRIHLTNGQTIETDYIVCAVGMDPDVELAKASGLEVDEETGGYLVNSELEARTNVWVAGDASCFYDIKLGRRRVEHHDHAIHSGRLAGQNMIGSGKAYTHQSMFWSDLGSDISFEAVGIVDSSLPTVSVFADPEDLATLAKEKEQRRRDQEAENQEANTEAEVANPPEQLPAEVDKYKRGVVFYLKDDVIVGVLLWNLFSRMSIARRILNEQAKYDDFNEVAKLFNLYLDD